MTRGPITKKDLEWLKLNEQIREVIITKKDWNRFKRYMKVYYENE